MKKRKLFKHLINLWIISFLSISFLFSQNRNPIGTDNKLIPGFDYKLIVNKDSLIDFKNYPSNSFQTDNFEKNKVVPYCKLSFWCQVVFNPQFDFQNKIIKISCPNTKTFKVFAQFQEDSLYRNIHPIAYYERNGQYLIEFPEKTKEAFIRIETNSFQIFEINSIQKEESFHNEEEYSLMYGLSIGVLFLILLYHLILFQIVKERSYLYFGLQTVISLLYILLNSGYMVISIHPHFHEIATIILSISLLFLFIALLRIRILKPSLYRKLLILIPLYILLGIIYVAKPSLPIKFICTSFSFIVLLFLVYLSIKHELKKGISSHLFTSAWILLAVIQLFSLIKLAFPTFFKLFQYSFEEFSLVLFNIIIALSIGYKLSKYKGDKNQAEKLELDTLKEKEQFLNEQNKILEILIQERNKEIIDKIKLSEKKKQEIEQQNETLELSSLEIEKINQILIQKNQEISDQNKELEIHEKNLEETVNKRTKKLNKSRKKAVVAEKLKTSFLKNLTHEISTPMSAIAGYTSLLTDKSILKDARNDYLGKINKYVDLLLETVDGIVTLSRIQSGIIKAKYSQTDLNQFYQTTVDQFKETINKINKKTLFKAECLFCNRNIKGLMDSSKTIQALVLILEAILKINHELEFHFVVDHIEFKGINKIDESLLVKIEINGKDDSNKPLKGILKKFVINPEIKTRYNDPVELNLAIASGFIEILKGSISVKENIDGSGFISIEIPVFKNEVNK